MKLYKINTSKARSRDFEMPLVLPECRSSKHSHRGCSFVTTPTVQPSFECPDPGARHPSNSSLSITLTMRLISSRTPSRPALILFRWNDTRAKAPFVWVNPMDQNYLTSLCACSARSTRSTFSTFLYMCISAYAQGHTDGSSLMPDWIEIVANAHWNLTYKF